MLTKINDVAPSLLSFKYPPVSYMLHAYLHMCFLWNMLH